MSNQNTQHGLADLGLGAPIGGGSTTSHSTNTYNTSSTSAGAPVSGLTGGHHHHDASHVHDANCGHNSSSTTSGLLGSGSRSNDHDPSHVHDANCGHDSSYGASGQTRNTTSGDQGIGRGHGGPTAFEADPSKVGEGRSSTTGEHRSVTDKLTGREHGQHGVSGSGAATAAGLTGAGHDLTHQHHHTLGVSSGGVGSDLRDREAGIKAGLGAGHHDQSSSGLTSGSGLTGSHEHHHHHEQGATSGLTSAQGLTGSHEHHHHSGAAAGVGAAAVGAAGVGLTGRQATQIDRDGVIADSVTGQTHFVEGQSTSGINQSTSGLGQQSTSGVGHSSTGLGAGAVGAGAAGAGLASHGQHSQGLTGQQGRSDGPLSGLKQELKEHQSGNAGHAVDHPESKGPHGLVWHNGKYVHERELSGHGSTGVPLR